MSFSGFWGLSKRIRRERSPTEVDEIIRKVTVVKSLQDVNLPTADEEVKRSLHRNQSSDLRKRTVVSDPTKAQKKFSQSETDLNRMLKSSEEILSSSEPRSERTEDVLPVSPLENVDIRSSPSVTFSPIVSSLSLEMPRLGPDFGIDEILNHTKSKVDNEHLSETSNSTSTSPEMWETKPRPCSLASSNSSVRSNMNIENSSTEALLTKRPGPVPKKTGDLGRNSPSKLRTEAVPTLPIKSKKRTQNFKQKPLPPVPSSLSVDEVQEVQEEQEDPHTSPLISELTSKYSVTQAESPIDRWVLPKMAGRTFYEPTDDLEREIDKLVDVYPNTSHPRSPKKEEDMVPPLNIPRRNDTPSSMESVSSVHQRSESRQGKSQSSRKHQTYTVFPPSAKSPPRSRERSSSQHTYYSNSSIDTDQTEINIKQEVQTSPSAKCPSRKMKSSVHLPSLRRPRFNQSSQSKHEKKTDHQVLSPVHSLRDEQIALAKSTDRYIDAEIAKALNIGSEEEEQEDEGNEDGGDNDEEEKKSSEERSSIIHSDPQNGEEGDWSTIYPLKAVKKLGIPFLTNSHIPRLSSSENERVLRQQLPKLDTNSNGGQMILPSPSDTLKKYPETPDDIGLRVRSFIRDPSPILAPTDDKELVQIEQILDSEKIFIGLDRMEAVADNMSPRTQEVPLVMGLPNAIQLPAIPKEQSTLYELGEQGSRSVSQLPHLIDSVKIPMPFNIVDNVVLALMRNVNNLDELFNYAQLNRQFYRVFKANELSLIKNALFNMNPPAWELREMSPPWSDEQAGLKDPDAPVPQYTPSSYLRHYARDVFVLAKLKTMIFARCGSFMRPETIHGLTESDNTRASEIDEAFWRIWTFCRIFGCGKGREGDINGQIDWLNAGALAKKNKSGATVVTAEPFFSINNVLFDPPAGFGDGNGSGLSSSQLYDMTEIWNCIGTLVQEFHRECKDARVAGVFEGLGIAVGDIPKEEAILEEWSHYLLTLGPSAIVGLSSMSPNQSVKEMFTKANQMGLTKWEAPDNGSSRSSFLREAISRTYERRVAAQQKNSATPTDESRGGGNDIANDTSINSEDYLGQPYPGNGRGPRAPSYAVADDEDIMTGLSSPPPRYSVTEESFVDPVDTAIHKIVHELGFSERDAKWALKITDTGDMLDINAAIQLLIRERDQRGRSSVAQNTIESGEGDHNDHLVDTFKHRGVAGWRWA